MMLQKNSKSYKLG